MDVDEDYLMLSEIQHFSFCRRQWALIHIEGQWQENLLTTQGHIMHEHAHDENFEEMRGNKLIVRGMRVKSDKLRVTGVCDVVEFFHDDNGISIHGRDGLWKVNPVEYKRGRNKTSDCDRLQLCGQALCLEEMLCCHIESGDLFYGETHRREHVELTYSLRKETLDTISEMMKLYTTNHTPKAKPKKRCEKCSLRDICLPTAGTRSASQYIKETLKELRTC